MINLLIADDEKEVGTFLSRLFTLKGYNVHIVNSGEEFFRLNLKKISFQVAMIDLKFPDCDGLTLLQHLKKYQPNCKSLIMTGYSTIKTAVEAMKLGASDYIEKPFEDIVLLEKHVESLLDDNIPFHESFTNEIAKDAGLIIGESKSMQELIKTAMKVAQKSINILIEGETGTGKEVLSRFIHLASTRKNGPFIAINCGALSESLLESELFGHEKGAFTGATEQRKGFFEIAGNGTLFLDEIADASAAIQVKLLRVLETKEFIRVGSSHPIRTNARLVAASHKNLQKAVENGTFREDLYYRLNVVTLKIPSLRERKTDIPQLIEHIIKRNSLPNLTFSTCAIEKLQDYDWPGNIRELANIITRTLTIADDRQMIFADHIALPEKTSMKQTVPLPSNDNHLDQWRKNLIYELRNKNKMDLEEVIFEIKQQESLIGKELVLQALQQTYGNRAAAAKLLNISMRKLRYILNEK